MIVYHTPGKCRVSTPELWFIIGLEIFQEPVVDTEIVFSKKRIKKSIILDKSAFPY
jgi:hypothetical protein